MAEKREEWPQRARGSKDRRKRGKRSGNENLLRGIVPGKSANWSTSYLLGTQLTIPSLLISFEIPKLNLHSFQLGNSGCRSVASIDDDVDAYLHTYDLVFYTC